MRAEYVLDPSIRWFDRINKSSLCIGTLSSVRFLKVLLVFDRTAERDVVMVGRLLDFDQDGIDRNVDYFGRGNPETLCVFSGNVRLARCGSVKYYHTVRMRHVFSERKVLLRRLAVSSAPKRWPSVSLP